ncbi:MAG: hypothetical protein LBP87_08045 [Planctomycetaceae bacterium]|jgi:hypothetical protein|nr:hypothetical protein [Planctomycetaceae bacterium]
MNNNHSVSIPPDVIAQALSQAEALRQLLAPYITPLTPTQRRGIAKMGDKTLAFVEKAYELAQSNPEFVPPFLNMSEFAIDFSDANNLEPLFVAVEQLHSGVDDTQMLAGSEAYHAALVYYNSVQKAATQNVAGAKAVYDALRVRFPHKKRHSEENNSENP